MLILVPATTDASISAPVSSAELAEIEAERKAIIETAKANGTYLKAPNGKDTNLTPEQWVNVRTSRFKKWFGDWEHDPKNASKVVDENGEPKVVYHGTPNEFYTFGEDTSNKHAWTNEGTFYFTDNEKNAETYGKRSVGAFLNIRNPYVYDFEGRSWRNLKFEIAVTYGRDNSILASGFATNEEAEAWLENFKQENPDHYAVKDEDGRYLSVNENTITGQAGPTTDEQTQIAKAEGYDGNIQTNIVDSAGGEYVVGEDGVMREVVDPEALKPRTNYVALDPNQIKSATENVGTYSRENNDIRYSLSEVNDRFNAELSTLTEENARERILNVGTPSSILLACGIEDKPIRLYGAKLLSKVRKHGYNIDDLKNLPLAMSEPIAVFKGSMENSFAILTELRIGDNNVLAALSVGKGGHDVDFNIISSVYDKRGDSVARWVNDGKLLYVDKEKALDYFSVSAPLAEAQNNQELISTTKVIQNFENPKIEPKNSLITPQMDADYLSAVERGDMETVQRMVAEAAKLSGYNESTDYQGSLAFNGAAPMANDYFATKEERKEAWDNGDYEGTMSLGDYADNDIDTNDLGWQLTDKGNYRRTGEYAKESIDNINAALKSGSHKITIYRAVPDTVEEGAMRNGDWVTPSRKYAEYHIGLQDWEGGRVIEQEVDIDDLWWNGDDINEWGYDDGSNYGYRNTPNNRKLLDPVTYDDNGNIIPLSERFNPEEADVRYSVPSNPFGGNSGYVGYSMSKRAAEAREEGRYPKTDFKKIYNIPQTTLDALVEAGVIYNKEWHHTSVWGNKTIFYGWGDEGEYPALAEYYKQNKKAIDKAVKEGADISEYIKGFEDAENALWEAERQKAIETANRIEEARKKREQREKAIEAQIAPMYKTSNGAEVYTHQRMYTSFWEAYKDGERLSKRNRVQERDAAFAEVRATIDEIKREYDTHFSLESEKIFSTAKDKFGITYDMREAGYILPDGSMLDFSGRHQVRDSDTSFLNGRRTVDHREIEDIAYDFDENETGVTTDMGDFLDRGAIRIDYNVGAINLNVAPTKEQRERLKRLIERNSGDVTIDFGKGWDTEHYAEYEGARASRVLGDIDRYFDEGIKSNGNVRHSLESVQPYATYATNMARTLNIEQPIFVADTAEEFVRLMRDAGSKDPDRVRVARGVYRYKEDAIFINAENFDTPEAMYNSILHEWTHGYTHRNIDKLEAILSTLDEERVKKSGAELLPKFYKNDTPLTILNEIISRFVERIPKPLLLATMRGQMPVEDLVNGLVKEIKGEEFADIIEAVSPVIKENLINQKDRYNGRREEPIVIARWSGQENNEGDEGVKGYLHRRRERGFGEHGHSQYHPAFDRRGESEDAQEVDYRHSIEEIIDTPSDEEYKQKMLALAQQMERDAESRGLDVAQQIADTTGWVHLDDGTWKYYGDVDITEDAQEVTRYIIAYTVSSISHVI